MPNLDTTRQPVSEPVDSGAPWAPDTPYTEKNNLFRVTDTIPADAIDIDGNAIVPNGLYCYPTVPHTSPASLTVPDLALMKRKGGSPDTTIQPFGDAQISIISPVAEGDRRHITLENASATGFGISSYLFHLSDDPSVVGTLSGTAITLQQGVAKDLYLVGPSTAGVPSDGDLQHNGTISAAHFTVTFDGFGLTYNLIAGHRIHPGDGNGAFDVRTFSEVAAVGPINFIETDFGLLFQGFAITTGQASTPRLDCLPQTTLVPAAEWTLTGGMQASGENLLIGSGGQQDGVAEYDYAVPVGNRSTKHIFSFDLREVDAAGSDIALRVEVEQAGSVFVSRDLLTTEVAQSITLNFVPTADVKIRIRDTSTGSQGSNRDALLSVIQVEATCQVGDVAAFKNVIPEVSNGAGANTGNISTTFTPTVSGDCVFEYSGDVQQGNGGMSVGTTALGTDLFVADPASGDADGSRLTLTRQENFTPPIPLTAGVTYHITQWAGGGGIILNHTVRTDKAGVVDNPSADGGSGYIDYPNGTRVQWGAATGSGSRTVTMPMSFINAEYNVTVNAGRAGTSVRRLAGWDDDSRTVNTFVCDAYTITNVDSAAVVYWQATGRWK